VNTHAIAENPRVLCFERHPERDGDDVMGLYRLLLDSATLFCQFGAEVLFFLSNVLLVALWIDK